MWVLVWRLVSVLLLAATLLAFFFRLFWKHLTFNYSDFHLPPSWPVLNVPFHFLAALKAVSSHLTPHKYFHPFQTRSNFVINRLPLIFLVFFVVLSIITLQLATYRLNNQWLCTPPGESNSADSVAYSDPSMFYGGNGYIPPFSSVKRIDSTAYTDPSMLHGSNDSFHPFFFAKEELFPSRNLIVRAAYFDPRQRNGHINTTVFLIEAHKHLLGNKSIVGCGVGNKVTTTLSIRVENKSSWLHRAHPHLTHDVAMVDCFDLPVKSGLKSFIWYKIKQANTRTVDIIEVESEHPCFVPTPKQTHNKDDIKIVTCMGIVRDFPSYLNEFIRYQRYLGVDHIYMTTEDSFIRSGGFQSDEYVLRALHEGYISFTFWHPWLNGNHIFYHSQRLAHQDCIYRFQGTYDYAFILDSDDFFIPLVPDAKSIDYYVNKYCHFGACIFPWIEFYPDCGVQWERLGPHGNVTNALVSHVSKRRLHSAKSIHRVSAILDAGTHKPQVLLDGYRWVLIPPTVAYVAHVRRNREPPGGMQAC